MKKFAMKQSITLKSKKKTLKSMKMELKSSFRFSNIVQQRMFKFYFHPLWIYKKSQMISQEFRSRSRWMSDYASRILKNARGNKHERPRNMIEALVVSDLDEAMITDTIHSMNLAV